MATEQDEFLFRLESAGAEEFAELLREPGQDGALRLYFGEELGALRAMAKPHRAAAQPKRGNVVVLHGLGKGLDESAVRTIKQWKFSPALKDGRPVAVMITIEMNFSLA